MGSSNENSAFHPVRNPRDTTRVPGGSSGGSAAAVAAGFAVATLGSDTGGSIRQPAAFCGVVGLLPTYGRVSRYGLIAFASSLDHVGPLTRTVKDSATLLEVIAGRDPHDSTSADVPVGKYAAECGREVKGLRIGIPKEYFGEGLDPEIRQAIERRIDGLRSAGCEIVNVSLPHTEYAIPVYYIVATAEASANLARFDGVRYTTRSPQAKDARRYVPAQPRRRLWRRGQAPHSAGHLRAQRRILRRLLPESAAGSHPAHPRLSECIYKCRCHRDPGHADRRPSNWARRPTIRWRCI